MCKGGTFLLSNAADISTDCDILKSGTHWNGFWLLEQLHSSIERCIDLGSSDLPNTWLCDAGLALAGLSLKGDWFSRKVSGSAAVGQRSLELLYLMRDPPCSP